MGEPWAGQVKAILDCSELMGNDSKFLANWGFAEPIGSTKKIFSLPKWWDWGSLSWAS